MARFAITQAAHSYGVLDPHAIDRRDTKFTAASLTDGLNITLLPTGGYSDRGGTTDFGRIRHSLEPIAINGTILDLPNGGSESDVLAGVTATTSAVAGSRFVLFELTFAVAQLVHMLDIRSVAVATTGADNALIAEWWDGAAWQPFGARLKVTLKQLSRRFASGPPGHAGHSSTKFRVSIDATTGATGAAKFAGVAAWTELGVVSGNAVLRKYAPASGTPYQIVFSRYNADVFEAGVWQCAVATPHPDFVLRQMKDEHRFDTISLWHTAVRPQFMRRLGSSSEWACDPIEFENMPNVDYGGVYTNGVDEVQDVTLYSVSVGEAFDLSLEGLTTTAITRDADNTVMEGLIKSALEGLSNVDPGLTVSFVSSGKWRVTFTGGANAARDWPTMVGTALDDNGYVRVSNVTQGKAAGEPIFSNARGWPAVGRFIDERLVMAGWPEGPNSFLASVSGDPINLNTDLEVSVAAFSYEIGNSRNTRILDIMGSRTILFFGDKQLVYLRSTNGLNAEESPRFGYSDAPGIKPATTPVMADNGVHYIQEGGAALHVVNYSAVEEDYIGDNASVLSAFLIRNPIDMARRRKRGAVDSDLVLSVNSDGTITALTSMRSQDVSGFAPWATAGSFTSLCVDHSNEVWFLVQRLAFGQTHIRLERQDPEKLLDEALEFTLPSPAQTVPGLDRFEGRPIWLIANNSAYGPLTVTAGSVTLAEPISGPVRAGSWTPPLATDPEISVEEESRQRAPRLKRVNRVEFSVFDTTSLAIGVNGQAVQNVPLRTNADFITDEGPYARPYTGKVEAEGMHGFTDHGRLTVTQLFPGRLTVRRVTKNVVA